MNNDVARIGGLVAVAVLPALSGISGSAHLHPAALADGFRTATLVAGAWCVAGGVLAAVGIRNPPRSAPRPVPRRRGAGGAPLLRPRRPAAGHHPVAVSGDRRRPAAGHRARSVRRYVDGMAGLPGTRMDGWLVGALCLLTSVTGVLDATSFLDLGRTFTANMTGNVLLLAFSLTGSVAGRGLRLAGLRHRPGGLRGRGGGGSGRRGAAGAGGPPPPRARVETAR